jgi:hypothetical protein
VEGGGGWEAADGQMGLGGLAIPHTNAFAGCLPSCPALPSACQTLILPPPSACPALCLPACLPCRS